MYENPSLIVNEKRLPATVKRLFTGTVYEIVGELLQNAQRAGASEIRFYLDREAKLITVHDNGSGIPSDRGSWAKVLRMADSFYQNESVEENQKPMGLGLLSLFALESIESVRLTSHDKTVLIDTKNLWEADDYWATWTELIEDEPLFYVDGFEIIIKYTEPESTTSHQQLAHKFEYALTTAGDNGRRAAPRGYQGFLKVFLDGQEVDASIPKEFTPSGENLVIDTFYQGNRLRIGQSLHDFSDYGYVVWYGQIIKVDSSIPFLLEVASGNPVTPLAPTRNFLVKDPKLQNLRRFVEDTLFNALADEARARRMKPQFVKKLHRAFTARAKNDLPVCVVREITTPVDVAINCYADFYDLGAEKVLSYSEIEKDKIEIFQSSVSCSADAESHDFYRFGLNNHLSPSGNQENNTSAESNEWLEIGEGLASFAGVLGGTIRQFVVGNTAKFPLKKIYWKLGAIIEKFFVAAGEFAIVSNEADPQETDFRPVTEQVFVFEYTGNFDIEVVDGLRVGIPSIAANDFTEVAVRWLTLYAKACFSPDDYDYDRQEEDFGDSISRLILELRHDMLSTDWSFSELKTVVSRVLADGNSCCDKQQNSPVANISQINFFLENGETNLCVRLENGAEIALKTATHIYIY